MKKGPPGPARRKSDQSGVIITKLKYLRHPAKPHLEAIRITITVGSSLVCILAATAKASCPVSSVRAKQITAVIKPAGALPLLTAFKI
jgi:hypothetical protein